MLQHYRPAATRVSRWLARSRASAVCELIQSDNVLLVARWWSLALLTSLVTVTHRSLCLVSCSDRRSAPSTEPALTEREY